MQQPALRVFLFLAVVSAQPVENKNNSSSAIPFRQKRSTYHWLYCPTGEQFIAVHSSDIMYGHVMREFEHKCQCYSDSPPYEKHKSWNTDRSDYYCGSAKYNGIFTGFISELWDFGYTETIVESACKIHDMCYETGRNQWDCDKEFNYNFRQMCVGIDVDSWVGWAQSWADWTLTGLTGLDWSRTLGTDCDSFADYAFAAVSGFGSTSQTSKGREMMQCRGLL